MISRKNTTHNTVVLLKKVSHSVRHTKGAQTLLSLSLVGLLALGLLFARTIPTKAWSNPNKPERAYKSVRLGGAVMQNGGVTGGAGATVQQLAGSYNGPPQAQEALNNNLAQPLALATADLNGDGTADLIGGYAGPAGGLITVLKGNGDTLYPNSPNTRTHKIAGSFVDSPFLPDSGLVFDAPANPDFLTTGDFNNDGHVDVALAARGGNKLFLMPGDGQGGFGATITTDLPGGVTAMLSGDVNRADGLNDLVIATAGANGSQVLVFEHPNGALQSSPEVFPMPNNVTALALGQLDGDGTADLAVASGKYLYVIHGRDRKLSGGSAGAPVSLEQRVFAFQITSLSADDFTGDTRTDVALLGDDGAVYLLSPPPAGTKNTDSSLAAWNLSKMSYGPWPKSSQLFGAHLSTLPTDSIVVLDSVTQQVHILTDKPDSSRLDPGFQPWAWPALGSGSIGVQNGVAAALPARLTRDGVNDLVMLGNGQTTPFVVMPPVGTIYMVTNTNFSGPGSLAQAIIDANNHPGSDTIQFSISTGHQTITVPATKTLPSVQDPVIIDGTTQPGYAGTPLVEISGSTGIGLKVGAGKTTVAGLVINGFTNAGIQFILNGKNILEGCFLGTDFTGTVAKPNNIGVEVTTSNTIGGTTAAARNLISGNSKYGIEIDNNTVANTLVEGNYIGTEVTGTAALANQVDGIFINASVNTIGGTTAGARNVISGNTNWGIEIFDDIASNSLLVQGNYIGLSADASAAISNGAGGFRSFSTPNVTLGGTAMGAGNTISGNTGPGILLDGADTTGSIVQGNTIGSSGLGNGGAGILLNLASKTTIGGTALNAANVISFNSGPGIAGVTGTQNAIRQNSIFSNAMLGIDLGNDGVTANDMGDADTGANNLQNFPVLDIVTGGTSTKIQGTLNSLPNTQFTLEYFLNPACDPSGFGQGQTFLGSATVTTDNTGNVSFTNIIMTASSAGQYLTATATDPNGNTSEFSACSPVCVFSLSSNTQNFPSAGGTNSFDVITSNGCNWTAVSNDSFITITSGASGSGNGTINYSVAANTATSQRTGTITAAGLTFTVTQDAAPCTFSIMPTAKTFTSSGGSDTVAVTAPNGCNWTAVSNDSFITVTSGASGSGNGTVGYTVAVNNTALARMGTMTIAGQTFTVTQNPANCTFSIMPSSMNFPVGGGMDSIAVTTLTGCNWTAVSNDSFITITSGASGSDSGTVDYTVASNPNPNSRMGTITVAGFTFTVTEDGTNPCTFTLSAKENAFNSTGGTSTVTVTTVGNNCNWTAVSNDSFITITGGASGSGSGTVSYSVAANNTASLRTGTMTIAGQVFTVFEAPTSCIQAISPTSNTSVPAIGASSLSVSVTAVLNCSWTAVSLDNFITITSGSGSGTGKVKYAVAANPNSTSRTGFMIIGNKAFLVFQAGQ